MNPNDKATKIKQTFSNLNRKFEEEETQRRASQWRIPYFNLLGFHIDQEALALVRKEMAKAAGMIPFHKEGRALRVGVIDPGNTQLKSVLQKLADEKFTPEVYLISNSSFADGLKEFRRVIEPTTVDTHEIVVTAEEAELENLKALSGHREVMSGDMNVSRLLSMIMGAALYVKASDVHLEPEKEDLKIRFRIDGVLQDITRLPRTDINPILTRIKLLAKLKLNIKSAPQDGRFSLRHKKGGSTNLRISTLPSSYGESVVIRILGGTEVGLEVSELGVTGLAYEVIKEELRKPNGMILTTGPTGSGKTTTLYAFLNTLNKPGIKIITLEDPVEYRLEGIVQTPIDRKAGLDFSKGLRAILRQDPDVVMVGEIRDFETAETASQAALTGHVVLSTLHTNDAAGAIPRLLDLGVKPVTLAPALNALIAQRLVRRLCLDCRKSYQPDQPEIQRVQEILNKIPSKSKVEVPERLRFYQSKGCSKCHDLGYRGRIGIFEVFPVDEQIEQLIFDQASTSEIRKAAIAGGMVTMQQDGLLKALAGLTDLSEVWRVTEE